MLAFGRELSGERSGQVAAAADADLAEDRLEVVADGVHGDEQGDGDIVAGQAVERIQDQPVREMSTSTILGIGLTSALRKKPEKIRRPLDAVSDST